MEEYDDVFNVYKDDYNQQNFDLFRGNSIDNFLMNKESLLNIYNKEYLL